ncbi:MAG: signal peptidase I [Planctomycetota bacterium]
MWFASTDGAVARRSGAAAPAAGRRTARAQLRFLCDALLGAVVMVAVHAFVIQVSIVRGDSMEPALRDGDRLVVDRVTYSLADVSRGDVVVLRYPRNPKVDFVKRVVGLPGDEVALRAGVLYVNGAPADDYGCIRDRADMSRRRVPEGEFFVLGDNRPVSCDSREFGLVAEHLIKGRVRARFWPLEAASVF